MNAQELIDRMKRYQQQSPTPTHEMRTPEQQGSDYIDHLRDQWAHSTDISTWEAFLEKKLAATREGVRYWAYCTDMGMRREAPEKIDEEYVNGRTIRDVNPGSGVVEFIYRDDCQSGWKMKLVGGEHAWDSMWFTRAAVEAAVAGSGE